LHAASFLIEDAPENIGRWFVGIAFIPADNACSGSKTFKVRLLSSVVCIDNAHAQPQLSVLSIPSVFSYANAIGGTFGFLLAFVIGIVTVISVNWKTVREDTRLYLLSPDGEVVPAVDNDSVGEATPLVSARSLVRSSHHAARSSMLMLRGRRWLGRNPAQPQRLQHLRAQKRETLKCPQMPVAIQPLMSISTIP
jgi:hypothetical protein